MPSGDAWEARPGRAIWTRVRERHGIARAALTPRELGEQTDDAEAVALLQTLEEARFGAAAVDEEALLARTRCYLERALR